MSVRWWLALSGVLIVSGAARADMGTPGFKFRELRVRFDNLGSYPDHTFYLAPAGWLTSGEPAFRPLAPGAADAGGDW
jgi:hypothetical protein